MAFSEPPRRRPDSLITPHKPGAPRFTGGTGGDGKGSANPPPHHPGHGHGGHGHGRPHRRRSRPRWATPLLALAIVAGSAYFAFRTPTTVGGVTLPSLRRGGPVELPTPVSFPDQDTVRTREGRWVTRYAPDIILQARTQRYINQYQPEGAVVVVCDLRTGQIRALVERDSSGTSTRPRMALGTTFPAASLAKIVTAAAVLEHGIYRPLDDLPLVGGAHTLYRSQLRIPHGHHNTVTLREAFARSINPTFGLLGLRVGSAPLRDMAERLGFNHPSLPSNPSDNTRSEATESGMETEAGTHAFQARLNPPDSGFALAEVASGYTTETTLSPLHALRIARAIGQDGRLLPTRFTRELESLDNGRVWTLPEAETRPFASAATLRNLRTLMEATVTAGTARRGFRRNMDASDFDRLEMGGKTGSLNGHNPPGRYEWFIGYARRKDHPDQGIAVAVMLINRTYLAVHAAELAGLVIRDWSRYSPPYPDEDGRYLAGR
jgi:peptidoglycan glycosyltransferase